MVTDAVSLAKLSPMRRRHPLAAALGATTSTFLSVVAIAAAACQLFQMAHADSAVGVCAKDAANDLREWPQLLAKGVRSLRVHPYYLSNSQCRAFGQHSSRGGCLILSRDAPHAVRQDFNSTSELVATIVAMSKYWPLGAPVSYLLLDFGAVPADACNTGTDWHTVVAQFANLAQRALKKVALRLVVASAAAKQQCLRCVLASVHHVSERIIAH